MGTHTAGQGSGWDRTWVDEWRGMGTHTAGQGSGWDRTWADGRAREGHARVERWRGWARTGGEVDERGTHTAGQWMGSHLGGWAGEGRARTGGEVDERGTHTVGQGSGWDRTWVDGRARAGHARAARWRGWARTRRGRAADGIALGRMGGLGQGTHGRRGGEAGHAHGGAGQRMGSHLGGWAEREGHARAERWRGWDRTNVYFAARMSLANSSNR